MASRRIFRLGLILVAFWFLAGGAKAQSQEPLEGRWLGQDPGSVPLELHLEQEGSQLSGYGLIQLEDTEELYEFFSFEGAVTPDGVAVLQVSGVDPVPKELALSLNLRDKKLEVQVMDRSSGFRYSSILSPVDAPVSAQGLPAVRLWSGVFRPFVRMQGSELYRVDLNIRRLSRVFESPEAPGEFFRIAFQFDLTATTATDYIGAWSLDEGVSDTVPALGRNLTFTRGRVAANNYLLRTSFSRVLIRTPDALTELGSVRFVRFRDGVPGSPVTADDPGAATSTVPRWRFLNRQGRAQIGYIAAPNVRLRPSRVTLVRP
jgi:hypothetical protein